METPVFRIDPAGQGRRPAGLAKGFRENQQAQQPLDGPPLLDESAGQIVEQFGMGGLVSKTAEVIHGGHDAAAKNVMPETVHHHPGRQRIVG